MEDFKKLFNFNVKLDEREIQLPETIYSHDIENGVFQSIVENCIASISGVTLVEGHTNGSFFKKKTPEKQSSISIEQHNNHSISVKINLSIEYGLSIPNKSEEVQEAIVKTIIAHTGLHVSHVHIVFTRLSSPADSSS